jgi:energy-coupling factor transporter ATP-binding protein EcfA2
MATRTVTLPERVSWEEFSSVMDWKQGEHVTLLGHTGSGKTTLARAILPMREHTLIFATKPRDESLDLFKREGYTVARAWPIDSRVYKKVVFWPKIERTEDVVTQVTEIQKCLSSVYRSGGWCVYFDEVRYLSDTLGLKPLIEMLWLQGRSLKVSVVAGTQRPAWVPLEAYSQATHLFMWRDRDETNLRRLQGIGSIDHRELKEMVRELPLHDVLYVHTRTGEVIRTRVGR